MTTTYQQSGFGFSGFLVIVIGPIVATAVLFVLLPLLTSISRTSNEIPEQTQIMIFKAKTQKAPDIRKKQEETRPKEIKRQETAKQKADAPKFDLVDGGAAGAGIAGTVSIGMVQSGDIQGTGKDLFKVDSSLYRTAFELSQVDKPPTVLRSVPPQYPFLAKRNNIEGRVVLRFIVDSDGNVVEPEISESEPEGVFDEAAIEAILKYKFKPAEKDGKAVDCIVNAPMAFQLR
ncbi:MAG: TonB family protein [Deltaproteobacteria bacterium]|nr:TonB family protein [Deltaproteobacteria bacterium]